VKLQKRPAMVQETLVKGAKNLSGTEAHAILFCPSPKGHVSGRVDRGLRKTVGVKEVTVNPITHNVKIRYDPKKVTEKKLRAILKKLHSDHGSHASGKKPRQR